MSIPWRDVKMVTVYFFNLFARAHLMATVHAFGRHTELVTEIAGSTHKW